MKKKKIVVLVIVFFVIIFSIIIYSRYNSRQPIGIKTLVYLEDNNSSDITVDNKNKISIVNITINSMSGTEVSSENAVGVIDTTTIEGLKNCTSFKQEEAKGTLTIQIVNEDMEVVKSFDAKSGEKLSKTFLLNINGDYKINVISNKYHGFYSLEGYNYKIF